MKPRRIWVDWVTSAACRWLWYGMSCKGKFLRNVLQNQPSRKVYTKCPAKSIVKHFTPWFCTQFGWTTSLICCYILLYSGPRGSWGRWGESWEGFWRSSASPALGISWWWWHCNHDKCWRRQWRWVYEPRTKDSEKGEPESSAGENPMFADDGVCCEYVETPGVDVRQDPLQFLLQEHSVRN